MSSRKIQYDSILSIHIKGRLVHFLNKLELNGCYCLIEVSPDYTRSRLFFHACIAWFSASFTCKAGRKSFSGHVQMNRTMTCSSRSIHVTFKTIHHLGGGWFTDPLEKYDCSQIRSFLQVVGVKNDKKYLKPPGFLSISLSKPIKQLPWAPKTYMLRCFYGK